MTKVKICGLFRDEDIQMVNEGKPDYVGFILNYPKSHRHITVEQLKGWRPLLADGIQTVGVFVNPSLEEIASVVDCLDVIQLHGEESPAFLEEVRGAFPEKELWKACPVQDESSLAEAFAFPSDKILLDYGKGEGKTFDWSILDTVERDYILAGGITLENVAEALERFHPSILDLSSGVETNQQKDPEKIKKLLEVIRQ